MAAKPFPFESDHYIATPSISPRSHSGGDDEAVIREVQEALDVEASGTFDEATRDAVLAFQKKKKIDESGVVDEATWKKLMV
jgi:peptidoglycan hydrolase-like protein with peptidoglycan-binding domain